MNAGIGMTTEVGISGVAAVEAGIDMIATGTGMVIVIGTVEETETTVIEVEAAA